MKLLKAIIIDDERHARESLNSLVELYCPEVKIIADASDIHDGKQLIEKLIPDLVFLDISIGEETGFDLLENLGSFNFQLIFTTAFSEYAIKAFRVNALDYLLKPIEPSQLQSAIHKVKQTTNQNQLQHQLTNLVQSFSTKSNNQISISTLEGIIFLETEKITHVNGSGNYSTFYMIDGEKIMASKSLSHYESLLPVEIFYRCHQSYLVNLQYVKKILTKEGNMVELKNGSQAPIAKRRKEELLSRLSR